MTHRSDIDLNTLSVEEKRRLLAQLLREKQAQPARRPAGHGQRGLWLNQQLAPTSGSYNVPFVARVRSPIDATALRRAFERLIQRHAALRTTFALQDETVWQQIHPQPLPFFEQIDAAGWEAEQLQARLRELAVRPFDLQHESPLRVYLVACGPQEHVLLWVAHHIVFDFWSYAVLIDELALCYAAEISGTAPALPALGAQFNDFVEWQAQLLDSPAGESLWRYWEQQLQAPLPLLDLPADAHRQPVRATSGSTRTWRLPSEVTQGLRRLAQREGTTLYTVLLTGFFLTLARYAGQDDLLIGTPTTGRNSPAWEQVVGYFVNLIPLRLRLAGNPTIGAVLAQVRQVVLAGLEHKDYPLHLLVERAQPVRDPARTPLFDTIFSLERAVSRGGADLADFVTGLSGGTLQLGPLLFESLDIPQQEGQYDLKLQVFEQGAELIACLQYNDQLFARATMERFAQYVQRVLEQMVADLNCRVGDFALITPGELQQIAVWNKTARPGGASVAVHRQVEAQAEAHPEAPAVVFGERRITYGELDRLANSLAGALRRAGVGPETCVALLFERSPEVIVAALATLKAGGAFLPLDPAYPPERLAFMLRDSGARVLLAHRHLLAGRAPDGVVCICLSEDWYGQNAAEADSDVPSADAQLAYVIYTSGSTGQPKGVQISHRGLANLCAWHRRAFQVSAADRATFLAGLAFDASVWEVWPYLTAGASLHIPSEEIRSTPARLGDWMKSEQITIGFLPTPLAEMMEQQGWPAGMALRVLLTGGDRLHAAPGAARSFTLVNNYGPTENSVVTTSVAVPAGPPDQPPPIGFPIDNTRVYVLDRYGQPVPTGAPGELYISGDGLARGYLGQPDLTAQRFLPDPFSGRPGERMYRSGDLVRFRADGSLDFIGRIDQQVKVRGFRIELAEIEATLRQHPTVQDAAVLAHPDAAGELRLVAYLVPGAAPLAPAAELREHLLRWLPAYMVPTLVVPLEALPLTSNGKVDRQALPKPPEQTDLPRASYVAPQTPMEQAIAAIWQDVLHLERVGLFDNFFELGGNSLRLVHVCQRLQPMVEQELTVVDLLHYPTVNALGAYLSRDHAAPAPFQSDDERARKRTMAAQQRRQRARH
jgi:amino acid adenylation domain-containing protein